MFENVDEVVGKHGGNDEILAHENRTRLFFH